MHYLLESLFVGIYTSIIYLLIHTIFHIKNIKILFFTVGFFKHFLGYYLHLHNYYCNYGDACLSVKSSNNESNPVYENSFEYLFYDSVLEGGIFLLISIFMNESTTFKFFMTGFFLHLLFELLGVHKHFCKEKCDRKKGK
jgi:hypothetical protein